MNVGKMGEASKKFDTIDRQHPFSEYARKSLVLNAFAKYRTGRHQPAITDAKRFLNLYPTDKDAAYAQYIIGLAYLVVITKSAKNMLLRLIVIKLS